MATPEFPDTPRGTYALRCEGRCPVHDQRLRVSPGYEINMDLFPSSRYQRVSMRYPFCLPLGQSFEVPRSGHFPVDVIWCASCVTNASYAFSDPDF